MLSSVGPGAAVTDPFVADATVTVDFAVQEPDGRELVGFINSAFPEDPEHEQLILDLEPSF